MPLSEEEARLLHQLEESLAQEDPAFASALRGATLAAHHRRRAVLSALAFVLGVVVLFAGAVVAQTWLGVLGFVVMLGGGYVFLGAWRSGVVQSVEPRRSSGSSRESFVNRMEQRWQRRQDGDH